MAAPRKAFLIGTELDVYRRTTRKDGRMRRKTDRSKRTTVPGFVSFDFGNRTYQIDPDRRKVYRAFVEIETSKAVEIFSSWRSSSVRVLP
jgi:hypothetical protein